MFKALNLTCIYQVIISVFFYKDTVTMLTRWRSCQSSLITSSSQGLISLSQIYFYLHVGWTVTRSCVYVVWNAKDMLKMVLTINFRNLSKSVFLCYVFMFVMLLSEDILLSGFVRSQILVDIGLRSLVSIWLRWIVFFFFTSGTWFFRSIAQKLNRIFHCPDSLNNVHWQINTINIWPNI